VPADWTEERVVALAKEAAGDWLQGKQPRKVIYVPKKLVNFVV
jgi:leucyl-tRNA synthetase